MEVYSWGWRNASYLHAEHAQCGLEENYGALVEEEVPDS